MKDYVTSSDMFLHPTILHQKKFPVASHGLTANINTKYNEWILTIIVQNVKNSKTPLIEELSIPSLRDAKKHCPVNVKRNIQHRVLLLICTDCVCHSGTGSTFQIKFETRDVVDIRKYVGKLLILNAAAIVNRN